jgi:hypothetical protein
MTRNVVAYFLRFLFGRAQSEGICATPITLLINWNPEAKK